MLRDEVSRRRSSGRVAPPTRRELHAPGKLVDDADNTVRTPSARTTLSEGGATAARSTAAPPRQALPRRNGCCPMRIAPRSSSTRRAAAIIRALCRLGALHVEGAGVTPRPGQRPAQLFDVACRADVGEVCVGLARLHIAMAPEWQRNDSSSRAFPQGVQTIPNGRDASTSR